MPKPLVIVESPAKARTIAGFLGDGFVVESSVGHIRDLPRNAKEVPKAFKGEPWARLGVDVDSDFKPLYVVPAEKREQVKKLQALLADAGELYLATDEDREGESIAWHLLEVLSPRVPVRRMVFHEITERAIGEAIENWRDLDRRLVDAQEARRVLDRLVGWEVSEVLWKKVMQGLSAGRVQSVATRLVVDRERERMAFRSAGYHDIEGTFAAPGARAALQSGEQSVTFGAALVEVDGTRLATGRDFDPATGRLRAEAEQATVGETAGETAGVVLLDEAGAAALAEALEDADFTVASVEARDYKQSPYPPFITSTLQQEAARKLRFSTGRTMAIAQRLYERGYITYMRTDSTALSGQAVEAARREIRERYGPEYAPEKPRTYKKTVKSAQEAHEAIRPAGETFRYPDEAASEMDPDEARLYELVWKRTVACQMADARGKRLALRLAALAGEHRTAFAASGKTIEFPGFLRAYVEGSDDPEAELEDQEIRLPSLTEGEAVDCTGLSVAAHATQPPARYTEASLVKELEGKGIGRPSTYASVLDTIQSRGYVFKKGQALVPSWTAFAVVQLLEQHFSELVDYQFTARMEEDLDGIARGDLEPVPWLHAFYFGNGQAGLRRLVADHLEAIDARAVNSISIGRDADGNEIVVRVGRYGPYLQRGETVDNGEDSEKGGSRGNGENDQVARASIPDDIPPDELTVEVAVELLERSAEGGRALGDDPETGLPVIVRHGRFGWYLQLGEPAEGEKPKTAGLLSGMDPETVTLDEALALLALPRVVGTTGEGVEITAQTGRYGPYIKAGKDTRSLDADEKIFTVGQEEARELLAQPKRSARRGPTVLKELGPHPETGVEIRVLEGRYGPYVTDGEVNASLPKGRTPEETELDEALGLLRERAAKGPAKRRRPTRSTGSTRSKTTKGKTTKRKTAKGKTAKGKTQQ